MSPLVPYASIFAQKNKKMNQCMREAVFQQKVSGVRKSGSDT
jgi:hypothetical protein